MFLHSIHAIARYNLWANEQLSAALHTLNDASFHKDIPSSFPSIIKTVAHLHGAEGVWHQRLEKVTTTVFYSLPENAEGKDEVDKWLNISRGLTDLVLSYNESHLVETLQYRRFDGTVQGSPRWQMIQHAVNHSTYHRGQLITMLRQVGSTTIPNTDMISFYRTMEQLV